MGTSIPASACNAQVGGTFEGTSSSNICGTSCGGCKLLSSSHWTKVSRSNNNTRTYGLAALGGNTKTSAFVEVNIGGDIHGRTNGSGYIQTSTYSEWGKAESVSSGHGKQ
ncbi:MAG: hypothetical protein ACRDCB_12760 [Clostridium sp.]